MDLGVFESTDEERDIEELTVVAYKTGIATTHSLNALILGLV